MYYSRFNTRFCEIILAGNEKGLAYLHLNTGEGSRQLEIRENWAFSPNFFSHIRFQVLAYLNGKQKAFAVPLNPGGTEFQKKVWTALGRIPYGKTASYAEIAAQLGNPKAARAVGAAAGKNPIPLIIPCHRVVGAHGKLTGFAHGLAIKKKLILLEKNQCNGGAPDGIF